MSSDAEIKKLLLSHPKVSKSSLQAVIRSKASKYRGFTKKDKGELIDMILSNKKDFKVFLSSGIKNLKPTVPATKIIKKMEVSKPVIKKQETVKKPVVKKETVKKAEPQKNFIDEALENWNTNTNNVLFSQNKKFRDAVESLIDGKKDFINLDSIMTINSEIKSLTKKLIQKFPFQKVLDGYKNIVQYIDSGGEKDIGLDKLKDYFYINDGRIQSSFSGKRFTSQELEEIKKQWIKEFGKKEEPIKKSVEKKEDDPLQKIIEESKKKPIKDLKELRKKLKEGGSSLSELISSNGKNTSIQQFKIKTSPELQKRYKQILEKKKIVSKMKDLVQKIINKGKADQTEIKKLESLHEEIKKDFNYKDNDVDRLKNILPQSLITIAKNPNSKLTPTNRQLKFFDLDLLKKKV